MMTDKDLIHFVPTYHKIPTKKNHRTHKQKKQERTEEYGKTIHQTVRTHKNTIFSIFVNYRQRIGKA